MRLIKGPSTLMVMQIFVRLTLELGREEDNCEDVSRMYIGGVDRGSKSRGVIAVGRDGSLQSLATMNL